MTKAVAKQVSLNIDETKDFLRHMIMNNRHLQENGKVPVSIELEGGSGIGKTSLTKQLADELDLAMVRLNIAQVEELGDIVGFPLRQFEMCKQEDKTVCTWIDEHAVGDYSKQGYSFTGKNRMSYCPPEWISGIEKGGILLLDDYTRADTRFLQACMTLLETQEYISWKLPKDWHIILTSNPDNGDYLVNVLDTAQKTRFISVNLKFDADCWGRWAEKAGIDTRCINFLLLHPDAVTEKCNARAITTFFNSISSIEDFEKSLPMIQMIGEGSVGVEFATMFVMFINNKLDKLISPKEILVNKDWKKIKEQMLDCIGKGSKYRADIASVLATRVGNYASVYANNNPINDAIIERLVALSTEDVLQDDLKFHLVKGIINSEHKAKFNRIMNNAGVVKMSIK